MVRPPTRARCASCALHAGSRDAEQIEHGRHDVDDAHRLRDRRAGRNAGAAHDPRDLQLLLVRAEAVPDEPVLAERLAVVGQHDDERVVGEAETIELGEEVRDLVVDLADRAVVGVDERLLLRGHLVRRELALPRVRLGGEGA